MKTYKLFAAIIALSLLSSCGTYPSADTASDTSLSVTSAETSAVTSADTTTAAETEPAGEFAQEFTRTVSKMKECYTLAEYKGINLDELYEEYLPVFEAADKEGTLEADYAAWMDFCNAIPDGHVYVASKEKDREKSALLRDSYMERNLGLDYGFCLINASDGSVLFANTGEASEAYEAGVRDGMKLLTINGEDVRELRGKVKILENVSDNFNRDFISSLYLTCGCGETITLTYEDESGNVCETKVKGSGSLHERYSKTLTRLLYNCSREENFSVKMLNDNTGVLYFNSTMILSSNGYNNAGDYEALKTELKEKILSLKEQGAERLIIDMRGNGGGYGEAAAAVASLFTDEVLLCSTVTGEPEVMAEVAGDINCYTTAENVWGDGEIVILVNSYTASAAELFIHTMKKLPNVTTMGFTNSCGCAMGVFGISMKNFSLSYPTCLNVDENGEIIIDADKSGDMKMPVDVRIPMTKDAIKALYTDKTDYVTEYALDYLSR